MWLGLNWSLEWDTDFFRASGWKVIDFNVNENYYERLERTTLNVDNKSWVKLNLELGTYLHPVFRLRFVRTLQGGKNFIHFIFSACSTSINGIIVLLCELRVGYDCLPVFSLLVLAWWCMPINFVWKFLIEQMLLETFLVS